MSLVKVNDQDIENLTEDDVWLVLGHLMQTPTLKNVFALSDVKRGASRQHQIEGVIELCKPEGKISAEISGKLYRVLYTAITKYEGLKSVILVGGLKVFAEDQRGYAGLVDMTEI